MPTLADYGFASGEPHPLNLFARPRHRSNVSPPALHRRTVLGALAAGTAAVAGCTTDDSDPDIAPDQRWPQHGYDAANTSYAPDADGPTNDPSIVWEYDSRAIQPIIGDAIFLNAAGDGCHAIDPAAGDRLWRDDGNYTLSTPAVADGAVYLAEHGGLRAVADDGGIEVVGRRVRYERWVGGQPNPDSPLTVADGTIFAGFGGPIERELAAVDAEDGSVRWRVPTETQIQGAPAVAGDLVVAADRGAPPPGKTGDVLAYGVSIDDGEVEWTHEFGSTDEVGVHWQANPVAGDGLVYVPTTRELVALDSTDGTVRWRRDGEVIVSPALVGDTLLVGLLTGELLALDATTGEKQWREGAHDEWLHAPAVAGETVYTVDGDGAVAGWTLDGDRRFQLSVPKTPLGPPAVGDGRLYVPTDGTLYAIA